MRTMGVSEPSLHRESTDSLIYHFHYQNKAVLDVLSPPGDCMRLLSHFFKRERENGKTNFHL